MGYRQSLNNGVLAKPETLDGLSQEGFKVHPKGLANGEDPKGFTSFTPNGVSRISLDNLVHKDNYGKREDGDQYDYASVVAPALPRG